MAMHGHSQCVSRPHVCTALRECGEVPMVKIIIGLRDSCCDMSHWLVHLFIFWCPNYSTFSRQKLYVHQFFITLYVIMYETLKCINK